MLETIQELTRKLIEEIGEDPSRDGLIRTPERVAKSWKFFSQGYKANIEEIVNQVHF